MFMVLIFQRTLKLLEADSPQSGSTEIMSILTEAQGYGNPPKEILAQLMPGMEFDADGNPIVPGIPGFEGASLGEPGADACTIM